MENNKLQTSVKKYVLVAVLITAAVAAILFLLTHIITSRIRNSVPQITTRISANSATLEHSIREMGELATLEYTYETVGVFEDQSTMAVLGREINIPGTARSFIVMFEGRMRFGIDMEDISVDITQSNEVYYYVRVSLPNPQIQTHELLPGTIQLLDSSTGLFSSLDLEDYTEFIYERMKQVENRASTLNLQSQAGESARRIIYAFLRAMLDEEYYRISIDWR